MKSSIKIDFRDNGKGKGLEPVIAIKLVDSDDVRDGLLKTFFQALGGTSSWLSATFDHHIINGIDDHTTYIQLFPVTPEELPETIKIISERLGNPKENSNFNSTVEHKGGYDLSPQL